MKKAALPGVRKHGTQYMGVTFFNSLSITYSEGKVNYDGYY